MLVKKGSPPVVSVNAVLFLPVVSTHNRYGSLALIAHHSGLARNAFSGSDDLTPVRTAIARKVLHALRRHFTAAQIGDIRAWTKAVSDVEVSA
jgi:hypothetical protein